MSVILEALAEFVLYAVLAAFAQNAVLSRALGVSHLVRLVDDGATGNVRPLVFLLITTAACGLVWLVYWQALGKKQSDDAHKEMGALLTTASFNSCVLGTMLIVTIQSLTLPQAIGFALGSGGGYYLAVVLVAEGQRRLRNRRIPMSFRGLPITLLYLGMLALAIYGFTGHTLLI